MTNGDRYLQYTFGWHHGAGRKAMDPDRAEHKDADFAAIYIEGYLAGQKAGREMADKASKRFDYKPNIIRAI